MHCISFDNLIILWGIKTNQKQWNSCYPLWQTYKPLSSQTWFLKRGPTLSRQVVNPPYQTPQGQSVAKPGTPLWNILVENLNMTWRRPKVTCSIQYSKGMPSGGNMQGGAHLQNQSYLVKEGLNVQFKIKRMAITIPTTVYRNLWGHITGMPKYYNAGMWSMD